MTKMIPWGRYLLAGLVVAFTNSSAPALVDCTSYQDGVGAARHFLPTGDTTNGRYTALAGRDGLVFASMMGTSFLAAPVLMCIQPGPGLYDPPIERSSAVLPVNGATIALTPTHAYLDLGPLGIGVADVSDPDAISYLASVPTTDACRGLSLLNDDWLVTAEWSAVRIYTLGDPALPAEHAAVPVAQARCVAVSGGRAYVARGLLGLSVIDCLDPSAPYVAAQLPVGGYVENVAVAGDLVLMTGYDIGLVVIDVSDPETPFVAATVPLEGRAHRVAARDGFAYVLVRNAFPGPGSYYDLDCLALVRLVAPGTPSVVGYFFHTEGYDALLVGEDRIHIGEEEAAAQLATAPLQCPVVSSVPRPGPRDLRLESARPNPFNPRVVLGMTVPADARGSLAVYDVRGNMVDVVWRGTGTGIRQEASWDGTDSTGRSVASGVYEFILTLGPGRGSTAVRATLLR